MLRSMSAALLFAMAVVASAGAVKQAPRVELVAEIKHAKNVRALAWSPDGKILATGEKGHDSAPQRQSFRLLDATTHKDLVPPT